MDYRKLSKTMSYILRHHPEAYGLKTDEEGAIFLEKLLFALRKKGYPDLKLEDIRQMMRLSEKQRFAIEEGKIRAVYGHSRVKVKPRKKSPPEFLYHGTSHNAYAKIKEEGLRPMRRRYVHLSQDVFTARKVGERRDSRPVVIKVFARKAEEEGQVFYYGSDTTWLTSELDMKYLERIE